LAVGLIADILHKLGMRAFDSNSKNGIFELAGISRQDIRRIMGVKNERYPL
jgi:hypothetical protein